MPTIRNTRDKFNELIDNLRTVKSGLNAEINAASREAGHQKDSLKEGIAFAVPALSTEIIERLDRASAKAKTGRDFTTMTLGLFHEDADTEEKIAALQQKWTSPEPMIIRHDSKTAEYKNLTDALDIADGDIRQITKAQREIDQHNQHHDIKITPATLGEFMPLNRWKYVTNETYRSGYKALRDYVPFNGNFTKDCERLETAHQLRAALASSNPPLEQEVAELDRGIRGMNALQAEIALNQQRVRGPEGILDTLRATALQLCLDNPNFTAALATELGRRDGDRIAVPALKIRTLERSMAGLKAHMKSADKTLQKLETPMSKLNKGARSAPSKTIRIDLDGIEKGVKGQVAAVKTVTGNASTFRSSVSSYTPAYRDDSSFYFMQNYLLMDMLLNHNDHAYCYNTIGIAQPCTTDFNTAAVPDMPSTAPTLDLQDFNSVAPDVSVPDASSLNVPDVTVPDVSVPDIQVSVPDISVPDISVPDISVPDISVPDISIDTSSFDTSSFSSYDSSSSFTSYDP